MTRRRAARWTVAVLAGLVVLSCGLAFGRAGGGEGFSGGFSGGGYSGGDSSGGGGGEGLFWILYLLFRLIVECPVVGIPLALVLLYLVLVSLKESRSAYMSNTIRRGLSAVPPEAPAEAALPALRQRDPGFDLGAFLRRCRDLLPAVQGAWSRQEMTPVRHFLSDGVFDRFSLQLEMQKGSGIRNDMRDVRVLDVRLAGSASDRFFDTLHVAITAEAVDTTAALADGRRLQGSGLAERFTELWTFLRRPGAQTLARPGLLEGCCPNCGTPLRASMSVVCSSCQALINSGEYDWVLTEITQREIIPAPPAEQIRGVAAMLARDPGFNPQAVEDRVSAIFWHHRAAEFFGEDAYLRAVALPSFVDEERLAWAPDAQGRHWFYADAAVGSVDLAEVVPGDGSSDWDRVRVRVQWSGHREGGLVPGLYVPQWERSRLMQHEYVLARKCGVQSDPSAALTSRHCPGCGAPQEAKEMASCRYCGVPQNDGSVSWVLESVAPFRGFARDVAPSPEQIVAGSRLPAQAREAMVLCAASVMMADGVVDPREERQLQKMAAKQGIAPERLAELMSAAQRGEIAQTPQFTDPEQCAEFLRLLTRMCLIDGNVSAGERRLLSAMAAKLGYRELDIDLMITRERGELYRASKGVLKTTR